MPFERTITLLSSSDSASSVRRRFAEGGRRHHPTAFVLTLLFEIDGVSLFEKLESLGPELQMKNFTFARQNVVFDAEAVHGFDVRLHDGIGYDVGQFGDFALTRLDGV